MAGSGGSNAGLGNARDRAELRREAEQEVETARLKAEVLGEIAGLLSDINGRDTEKVNAYLDDIAGLADSGIELETILFGGSVAKHTYVDGLSDVDSLVVLDADSTGSTPGEVLDDFAATLRGKVNMGQVAEIAVGQMAVSVEYNDGTLIQLLPVVRNGENLRIGDEKGESWRDIRPRAFAERLTKVNQESGNIAIPTIKLAKSAISQMPESQRPSGYHIEAMAAEAFKNYSGARNPMDALQHLVDFASKRVLAPISDPTGQSTDIGSWMGGPNSQKRNSVATELGTLSRRLRNARSGEAWRQAIAGDDQ